jgi:hypothetical protein
VLTPLTADRVHPVNDFIRSLFVASFVGTSNGIFPYVYPGSIAEITVIGVISSI